MATALLTINCRGCGREENIIESVEDNTVDFNLDKMCASCGTWMTKRDLIPIGTIWAPNRGPSRVDLLADAAAR